MSAMTRPCLTLIIIEGRITDIWTMGANPTSSSMIMTGAKPTLMRAATRTATLSRKSIGDSPSGSSASPSTRPKRRSPIAQIELKHIAFGAVRISKLNMRSDGKHYGAIAGRRGCFAPKRRARETGKRGASEAKAMAEPVPPEHLSLIQRQASRPVTVTRRLLRFRDAESWASGGSAVWKCLLRTRVLKLPSTFMRA
jgi:hypothetical protein